MPLFYTDEPDLGRLLESSGQADKAKSLGFLFKEIQGDNLSFGSLQSWFARYTVLRVNGPTPKVLSHIEITTKPNTYFKWQPGEPGHRH